MLTKNPWLGPLPSFMFYPCGKSPEIFELAIPRLGNCPVCMVKGFDSWFGLLVCLSLNRWPSWFTTIVSCSFRLLTEWVMHEDLCSGNWWQVCFHIDGYCWENLVLCVLTSIFHSTYNHWQACLLKRRVTNIYFFPFWQSAGYDKIDQSSQ